MTKIANDNPVAEDGIVEDNIILPFQLQESGLRGRFVRLGSAMNDILKLHDYPDAVSHMVADTVTLTTALSSMLKYEGIFTLQTSSKGAVKTLVSDIQTNGAIRGCATFDKDSLKDIKKSDGAYDGYKLADLTGDGYIAFTVDQGAHTERYQGIVALEGETLQESIAHYFEQSEQLRTSLYVASRYTDGEWRSGALMLQYLPDDHADDDGVVAFSEKSESDRREDWHRSRTLLQTCTDDEILDMDLHPHELLRRLFHEEGVIAYDSKPVHHECRCSREKVEDVVAGLNEDDKSHAAKNGEIKMTCEFCSKTYTIKV
jgi:molecular chaperone Hsp33